MRIKRRPKELLRRSLVLCIGIGIMAFGVAFSIKAALGTTPISSAPYVISQFTPLSVGAASFLVNCVLIALQIVVLRRQYDPVQLIQIPVVAVFGYLADFALWATQGVQHTAYWQQWLLCLVGIALVALGVSLEVTADVVCLPGEGLVLAICRKLPVKFGTMKVILDVSLVVCAAILSLVFLGRLVGVREGTVAAAILVGLLARQINKPMKKLDRWFQAG